MKDYFLNSINAGDYFIFCQRYSNQARFKVGIVDAIKGEIIVARTAEDSWGGIQTTKASRIGNTHNMIVVNNGVIPPRFIKALEKANHA